jgi:chromosome segregation ATPase
MSFSDLLTSSRGPGVIGMLMAMMVLLGFGFLFFLSSDESLQGGGPTLASAIRKNEQSIASYQTQIEAGNNRLATIPVLKEIADTHRSLQASIKSIEDSIDDRKHALIETKKKIAETEEEFEIYKNRYRAFVRNSPDNRDIAKLTTNDGVVYTNVMIRAVNAVGIEIRHSEGHKRIPYENLPEELQDYYQFDKDQKIVEIEREAAERARHVSAVAAANEASRAAVAEQRIREQEAAKQKRIQDIALGRARLRVIQNEITQLEKDLVEAEKQAELARKAKRSHLNKTGTIRSELAKKHAEYSRVTNEIARLQSQL